MNLKEKKEYSQAEVDNLIYETYYKKIMLIHQLFPEPLYFSKLERVLTQEELKIINEREKENL